MKNSGLNDRSFLTDILRRFRCLLRTLPCTGFRGQRLRNSDYKDIPVVFLTGVSEKETVIKTLVELKPQGYILKPSKKSEIVAKIIDVLG